MKLQLLFLLVVAPFTTSRGIRAREKPPLSQNNQNSGRLNNIKLLAENSPDILDKSLDTINLRFGNFSHSTSDLNQTLHSSPNSTICLNDSAFIYKGKEKKTCRWIRWKEARRTSLCTKSEVRLSCPQTCGLCCEDDPYYLFNVNRHLSLNCKSIKKKTTNLTDTCNTFNNGRMVRDGCPVICNFCQQYVLPLHDPGNLYLPPPTLSPSLSPSQSPSDSSTGSYRFINDRLFARFSPTPSPSLLPLLSQSQSPSDSSTESNQFINDRSFAQFSPTPSATTPSPTSSIYNHQGVPSYNPSTYCRDNDFYQSPLGGHCGCSLFEATDCTKWDIFLTEIEIIELMDNCPVACGICM
jgi:hypothetical protein